MGNKSWSDGCVKAWPMGSAFCHEGHQHNLLNTRQARENKFPFWPNVLATYFVYFHLNVYEVNGLKFKNLESEPNYMPLILRM